MTDRLDLANAFEAAGIERKAAEIFDAIRENVATKADLAAVQGDIAGVRTELKSDIAAVRPELRETELRLQARSDLVEHRLMTRLGGLVVVVGLLFATLHYWPPHG